MKKTCWFLLGVIMFASGCSTIVKGRYQEVSFQSAPDNVTVIISGRTMGKTPLTATLKKASGQVIIFEKDGYKPLTMSLETRTSGWFWGNIVLGGFIGSTTDGVSGAIYEYSPSQYMVTLQPITTNAVTDAPQKNQKDRVKEFIVVGYSSIRADLNAGAGQYLSSLLELLNVHPDKRNDATVRLKNLADSNPNIMDFADQVIATFIEQK